MRSYPLALMCLLLLVGAALAQDFSSANQPLAGPTLSGSISNSRTNGISTSMGDEITERGDCNLDGIPWTIGDAVYFSTLFADPQGAGITCGDLNLDGVPNHISDLVYMQLASLGLIDPQSTQPDTSEYVLTLWDYLYEGRVGIGGADSACAVFLVFYGDIPITSGQPLAELNSWTDGEYTYVLGLPDVDYAASTLDRRPLVDGTLLYHTGGWLVSAQASTCEGILLPVDVESSRGDCNRDGVPWSIADVVSFGNYFNSTGVLNGCGDPNQDGQADQVSDYVYVLLCMLNLVDPSQEPAPTSDQAPAITYDNQLGSIHIENTDSIGALCFVFSGDVEITAGPSGAEFIRATDGQTTLVFELPTFDAQSPVFQPISDGELFTYSGGSLQSVQASNRDGARMPVQFLSSNCCTGLTGNVNGDPLDSSDLSDLIFLVNYLFLGGQGPVCPDEANVDGDSQSAIDLSDLIYLVGFLFQGGPEPAPCP
ncbi:MAG: hypothetical protein RBT76_03810 [candidate division Zixibacteria bacterium]|jgi:hypothetical protein|nr:hypothetical protein [candidate division Zixibacteria bacterium]